MFRNKINSSEIQSTEKRQPAHANTKNFIYVQK